MAEIHSKKVDRQMIDTWLEDDVTFEGSVKVDKNISICGHLSGSIKADGDVYINKEANITADINSKGSVFIVGKVHGNVNAQDRVELATEASLDGDVVTGKMVIEDDCYFNGLCKMRQD